MAKEGRDRDTLSIVQLVPSLITIVGLCAGLSSIRYVLADRFEIAALLIIFAASVDGLDGLTARRLGATSLMGAELDTLSDFVSFGVAPAVLVFQFSLNGLSGLGWGVALGFSICCCLRLARFNVARAEPAPTRTHFVGVPAPAGALLALLPVFLEFARIFETDGIPLAVAAYLGLIGLLMVSTLPTSSLRSVHVRRDQVVWVLAGVAVLVGLMLTRLWLLMVLADIGYLAALLVAWMRRRLQGREALWTPRK